METFRFTSWLNFKQYIVVIYILDSSWSKFTDASFFHAAWVLPRLLHSHLCHFGAAQLVGNVTDDGLGWAGKVVYPGLVCALRSRHLGHINGVSCAELVCCRSSHAANLHLAVVGSGLLWS